MSSEFVEQIGRARNGDREATERLLRDWRPWMRKRASGLLGKTSRLDSSDVVQISMAEVFRNVATFRGQSTNEWAAWLQQILQYQATRLRRHNAAEMRKAGREVTGSWSVSDSNQNPTLLALERERRSELRAAISRLPNELREVVERRAFQNEPFTSIAKSLECSPRTVRRQWAEAIRHLARHLCAQKNDGVA